MDPSPASAIPRLDLTGDPETLRRGSEEWGMAVRGIKEALGTHGPLYESIRVANPERRENAEAVARLLWPNGNDEFCNAVHTVGSKMTDMISALVRMILDGYGLGGHLEAFLESTDETSFRLIKYSAPGEQGQGVGLQPHADPGYLTVLGQNDVPGLAVRNSRGDWVGVDPGAQGCFVVFVAQSLRAFSNGRLHAPLHRVGLSGAKDRLSYALFLSPKPDSVVEAVPEMAVPLPRVEWRVPADWPWYP